MTIIVQTNASESARDYDWLKASVAKWLHRSDLTAVIPDFVMMAEKRINGDLDGRMQESLTIIPTTAGIASVSLPDDVVEVKSLSNPDYGPLDFLPAAQFNSQYAVNTPGAPRHYTVIGSSFYLGPTPDAVYSLQCYARTRVPALADSAGTNWLIEKHADVYLAASMCEALLYTKDQAGLQTWEGKYAAALSLVNSTDWGSVGTLAVRTDTRNP